MLKKYLLGGLVALVAALFLFYAYLFSFPLSAQADSGCVTLSNGDQACNIVKTASSDSNGALNVLSVTRVGVKGKIVLRFVLKNGFHVSGVKCFKRASFTQVPHGAKCWIATMRGFHFENSGINDAGQLFWFEDFIGSQYSPVGTKFIWDAAAHTWRKSDCGNFVRFHGHEKVQVSQVLLVRTFAKLKIQLTASLVKTLSESVSAQVSCSTNGSSASATGHGSDSLSITVKVSAVAKTLAKAKSMAEGQAIKLAEQQAISENLVSKIHVQAVDNIALSVNAKCNSSGGGGGGGQQQSIIITSMTQINEVSAGDNTGDFNIGVDASAAGGSLTVDPGIGTVSDCNGGSPQSSLTISNLPAGNSTQCVIFYAPNDASQPPSMTVTATAMLGSSTSKQSETFNITYPTRPS